MSAFDPKRTSVPMGDEAVGLNLAVQILLKDYIERAKQEKRESDVISGR
jgi:hypothetical protein